MDSHRDVSLSLRSPVFTRHPIPFTPPEHVSLSPHPSYTSRNLKLTSPLSYHIPLTPALWQFLLYLAAPPSFISAFYSGGVAGNRQYPTRTARWRRRRMCGLRV